MSWVHLRIFPLREKGLPAAPCVLDTAGSKMWVWVRFRKASRPDRSEDVLDRVQTFQGSFVLGLGIG